MTATNRLSVLLRGACTVAALSATTWAGAAGEAFDETACWRSAGVADQYRQQGWQVIDVRRVWANPSWPAGQADTRHNAFPDLVRFGDHWYCSFRMAADHGGKGRIRVLRSADGRDWTTVLRLDPNAPGTDLRDTKLAVTAKGELMLLSLERYIDDQTQHLKPRGGVSWRTFTYLSGDGNQWTGPHCDPASQDTWIWSVTWHKGAGYGVGYGGKDANGCLYRTADGKRWEVVKDRFFPPQSRVEKLYGNPTGNETSLAFDANGMAWCYVRGGARAGGAHLGWAKPPYEDWTWVSRLPVNVGGPELVRLSDGRYIIGGREGYGTPTAKNNMVLWELDPQKAAFTKILTLPSGGDCSYPGIVEHRGQLWVAYYSSHEDPNPEHRNVWNQRSCIYLARIKIGPATSSRP